MRRSFTERRACCGKLHPAIVCIKHSYYIQTGVYLSCDNLSSRRPRLSLHSLFFIRCATSILSSPQTNESFIANCCTEMAMQELGRAASINGESDIQARCTINPRDLDCTDIWVLIFTSSNLPFRDLFVGSRRVMASRQLTSKCACRLVSRKWNEFITSMLDIESLAARMLISRTHVHLPLHVSCYHRHAAYRGTEPYSFSIASLPLTSGV